MKNSIFCIAISLLFLFSCEKENVISINDVPFEIKSYVVTHFPATAISRAVKGADGSEWYEIYLTNGVSLEFNKHKEIIDIDWNAKLPDSVIPGSLLSYANSNYPNNFIIGWKKTGNNQQVELNNQLVLLFASSGQFIRIEE